MTLAILQKVDERTAEGILAAAALASAPNPGISPAHELFERYQSQAAEAITEIRAHLRIGRGDTSSKAKAAIDTYLASELKNLILGSDKNTEVLTRIGQSGQLAPVIYDVTQPKHFGNLFYTLGVKASHVEDAVKRPDDYQHLMTEGLSKDSPDARTISLFLKRVSSRDPRNSHWLLVQTHRSGIIQVAQSAWRIYPADIDLSLAKDPLDVLRAFVEVFGYPLTVDDKFSTLFIEAQAFPMDAEIKVSWDGPSHNYFFSISHIRDEAKHMALIGTAYCINLIKYSDALKSHGVNVLWRPVNEISDARGELRITAAKDQTTTHLQSRAL